MLHTAPRIFLIHSLYHIPFVSPIRYHLWPQDLNNALPLTARHLVSHSYDPHSHISSSSYLYTCSHQLATYYMAYSSRLNHQFTQLLLHTSMGGSSPRWMYPQSRLRHAKSSPPPLLFLTIRPKAAYPGIASVPMQGTKKFNSLMGSGPARPDRPRQRRKGTTTSPLVHEEDYCPVLCDLWTNAVYFKPLTIRTHQFQRSYQAP